VPVFGQASHGYVMILDTRTGERVGRPEGSAQPFTSTLAWSPDSTWRVFAAGEGVDAWNAPTGGVIKLGTEPVQALAALDVRLDDRPAVDHGPRRGASGAGIRR
jgi:hypothetical protein